MESAHLHQSYTDLMMNEFQAVIGGDIGGTHIRLALVDTKGKIRVSVKSKVEGKAKENAESFLNQLLNITEELLGVAKREGLEVIAIGIGVAGKIDQEEGSIIFSPNLPQLNNFNISKGIKKKFDLPVFIENDANVFGIGEFWVGKAKEFENWLGITLGTGVGGCLFLNRKIWRGDPGIGFVAEIGHTTVFPGGRVCNCGKLGCLEAYASNSGLVRIVKKDILEGWENAKVKPNFAKDYLDNIEAIDSEFLFNMALKGDPYANALFEEFGYFLGVGISNVFTLLGICHAVIGGGVSKAWDVFFPALKRSLEDHSSMLPFEKMVIVKSELLDNASIVGSAKYALDRMGIR